MAKRRWSEPRLTAFAKALIAQKLDRLLFTTITAQLKAMAVTAKTGRLVDATYQISAVLSMVCVCSQENKWCQKRIGTLRLESGGFLRFLYRFAGLLVPCFCTVFKRLTQFESFAGTRIVQTTLARRRYGLQSSPMIVSTTVSGTTGVYSATLLR